MSDELIKVSVTETPITITADTGTYTVTATDLNDPVNTTIINASPIQAITVDERPVINVYPGSGSILDQSKVLAVLGGALDIGQFSPELSEDITLLQDLWLRTGDNIGDILITEDITGITTTAQEYTDTQIQTVALDITRIDGEILANTSSITQTANSINSRVDTLELDTNNNFTAQSAQIDTNASGITLATLRMDSIDGDINQVQANISIQADRITQEVTDRTALEDGAVAQNTTTVTQTADSLVTVVTATNSLDGRVTSAETRLTDTEVITTILAEEVDGLDHSLQAVESLTANAYSVTITENAGGQQYASGFGLILHPTWFLNTDYTVDYTTKYSDDNVYKCILAHTSTVDNSPGSAASATYWVQEDDSAQSSFNISAGSFNVIDPAGGSPIPVFTVSGNDVTINGDLVIAGSIQSDTYDPLDLTNSWYYLNHTTGAATFNNMEVSFTGGSTIEAGVLQDSAGNMIIDLPNAEITINNPDGMLIDSSGGLTVDGTITIDTGDLIVKAGGDIIVNHGGDLYMQSTSTGGDSQIIFEKDNTEIGSIYGDNYSSWLGYLYINPPSSSALSHKLQMGELSRPWDVITLHGDTSSLYSGDAYSEGRIATGTSSTTSYTVMETFKTSSDQARLRVQCSSTTGDYVETSVGSHSFKMVGGIEVHTGLANATYTSTAYDSLIGSSLGDSIVFTHTDGRRVRRYRDISGNVSVTIA